MDNVVNSYCEGAYLLAIAPIKALGYYRDGGSLTRVSIRRRTGTRRVTWITQLNVSTRLPSSWEIRGLEAVLLYLASAMQIGPQTSQCASKEDRSPPCIRSVKGWFYLRCHQKTGV